tara:strand:+ start:1684 stop:3054 length:1371 start_codon:yes stop_codon:yes gene_type:complete
MRDIKEFQILDINAVSKGYSIFDLMKNAGNQLAMHIQTNFSQSKLFLFVCGKGNNAGDGYVAASILHKEGFKVKVINVGGEPKSVSKEALKLYRGEIIDSSFLNEVSMESTLLVDCLLGSGIKGEPISSFREIIAKINNFKNILSVDLPSGFAKKTSVVPTQTLTFHDMKTGMNSRTCGEIFVVDIGITSEIDEYCGPGELELFPKFDVNKHKGQNGKVAIIGGGEYAGAPSIAGMGAYRSGVDLVHVFVPSNNYDQVSAFAPELIVHKMDGEFVTKSIVDILRSHDFDSVVIGPGMGKRQDSLEAVSEIIANFDNLVIDADAISNYKFNNKNILLTPHKGELSRLGAEPNKEQLMQFSIDSGVTLLFKGKIDYITDGINFKMNSTGHPRLAVGGTGDLLAGVCGGLIGRGLSAFEAGRLASYVIGLAGEKCFEENGPGFIPSDLALCVSKIFGKI